MAIQCQFGFTSIDRNVVVHFSMSIFFVQKFDNWYFENKIDKWKFAECRDVLETRQLGWSLPNWSFGFFQIYPAWTRQKVGTGKSNPSKSWERDKRAKGTRISFLGFGLRKKEANPVLYGALSSDRLPSQCSISSRTALGNTFQHLFTTVQRRLANSHPFFALELAVRQSDFQFWRHAANGPRSQILRLTFRPSPPLGRASRPCPLALSALASDQNSARVFRINSNAESVRTLFWWTTFAGRVCPRFEASSTEREQICDKSFYVSSWWCVARFFVFLFFLDSLIAEFYIGSSLQGYSTIFSTLSTAHSYMKKSEDANKS